MSEYDVYIKTATEDVKVDLPDIYRDEDSETNTDQIKKYISDTLGVDYYTVVINVKRNGKMNRNWDNREICNGDILYIEFKNKEKEQDLSKLKMKVGFSNNVNAIYADYNYTEKDLENVLTVEEEYKQNLDMILSEVSRVHSLVTDQDMDKMLHMLLCRSFKPVHFTALPMHKIDDLLGSKCLYYGKLDINGYMCGTGYLYLIKEKKYFEGTFCGVNIFNASCLDMGERPSLTRCNFFNALNAHGNGDISYIVENIHYTGHFENGLYHGKGVLINNLGIYNGLFKEGLFNGYGTMKYINGEYYMGFWCNGKRNMFGKMLYKDKSQYVGTWINDMREEMGSLYIPELENHYVGTFHNDNATFIEGEFVILNKFPIHNHIIGEMELCLKETENGKIHSVHGKHIHIKDNAKSHSFKNYLLDSIGPNRQGYYIGQFDHNDIEYGMGKLFSNRDEKIIDNSGPCNNAYSYEFTAQRYKGFREYQCIFVGGTPNGFGMVKFENGEVYIGHFRNGNLHGSGIMKYNDGKTVKGFWRNNLLRNDLLF